MGHLGKFIVTKQCKNLGIDAQDIDVKDLSKLSKVLGEVMMTFSGDEKARKIEQEIKKISL